MAAFLYSEASAINAEGNTNHSGARTAEGNPWASMASPCRAGAGGGDPGASVASHPSAAAAAGGDPVTSRASPSATAGGAGGWSGAPMAALPPRLRALVVIRWVCLTMVV